MAERKTYVICDDGCKFEAMTKEEILAAIAEATGKTLLDVDGAFITMIKEQNAGNAVKVWVGTQDEYNALQDKDPNTLYFYGDTEYEDLAENVAGLMDGTIAAKKAEHASSASTTPLAQKAICADYASSDTSKGTIEDRLMKLGFKEGSVTISKTARGVTHNYWKRQGNYVFGKVYATFDTVACNSGSSIFTLPENALPKEAVEFVAYAQLTTSDTTQYAKLPVTATIGTNGVCTISYLSLYWFLGAYANGTAFKYIQEFKIDFGFEATPIS